MPYSFSVENGIATIIFEIKVPADRAREIIKDASEALWIDVQDEHGTIQNPFDQSTISEKVKVVFDHIKRVILDVSNHHKSKRAQESARSLEESNPHNF